MAITAAERLTRIVNEYAGPERTDAASWKLVAAGFLLVERTDDEFRLSTWPTADAAGAYHLKHEDARNWTVVKLVDLASGAEYRAEPVIAWTETKPEDDGGMRWCEQHGGKVDPSDYDNDAGVCTRCGDYNESRCG